MSRRENNKRRKAAGKRERRRPRNCPAVNKQGAVSACTTLEEAKAEVTSAMNDITTQRCGHTLPILTLGEVDVSVGEFLQQLKHAAHCKNRSCLTVFNRQMQLERQAMAAAEHLAWDESAYAAGSVTCTNGCVGILIMCPSPVSPIGDQCIPIAALIDCDMEGIEQAPPEASLLLKSQTRN